MAPMPLRTSSQHLDERQGEMRETDIERQLLVKANRRRSLSVLFRIPLSTRTSSYSSVLTPKPIGSIPTDIIREIADLLSASEILNFSLTCSTLRTLLIPALYESVVLKSSRKCRVTLTMLDNRPDICEHIRKFAVRPNYYLSWPKPDEPLDEDWVTWMIEKIASSLKQLHTFDWDGLEVPMDSLWGTLRRSCPKLRNIFSNVGSRPLDPCSQLFEFSNLKSFSLIVRYGLHGSELFPPLDALPEKFWDMLVKRSPELEELAICSFSSSTRIFDFLPVTEGRWSKLHSLTLGSFGYQSDFTLGAADELSFSKFLDSHPSLKYIRLQWNFKRWMSPSTVPLELSPSALPELDTFIGIYQQLAKLPNPWSITTLDLTCEPLHESRLEIICPILRRLTFLSSLDIWIQVPSHRRELDLNYIRSILSSCPKLTDLHLMCTTTFTGKSLKQLVSELSLLPELKRFSLTKGHKYGDESMLESVLQTIRCNPNLQQINIRWAREKAPNHLKQEGTYDITCGEDGTPDIVMVQERGIPLVGRPFHRHYRYKVSRRGFTSTLRTAKVIQMLRTQ